jgi:hypothetical protein
MPADDSTSKSPVGLILAHFDAAQAKCFLDRDRQRLLAVVEASFGTFAPFNTIVRGIFAERLRASEDLDLGLTTV